jgi:hypothetical protein
VQRPARLRQHACSDTPTLLLVSHVLPTHLHTIPITSSSARSLTAPLTCPSPPTQMMSYRRIDGHTSLEQREVAIQDFNRPNSDVFIFLLSIRAAGRGLNLQTSDTVIVYDPDPNPKNEEQAVARSHRIGQKKEVGPLAVLPAVVVQCVGSLAVLPAVVVQCVGSLAVLPAAVVQCVGCELVCGMGGGVAACGAGLQQQRECGDAQGVC